MKTFTSVQTYFSVAPVGGCSMGALYVSRDKAEAKAALLNREWNGERTFTVKTETIETFTAHEM
tara:strand:+ start:460 stop:651 length:192 start_codon:yes stop_codon:yes gene_type:complete